MSIMSEMIRKQFYIHKRHQLLLRKLAQAKGVSEAEIVRQAIEHEAAGMKRQTSASARSAWEEIVIVVGARKTLAKAATHRTNGIAMRPIKSVRDVLTSCEAVVR